MNLSRRKFLSTAGLAAIGLSTVRAKPVEVSGKPKLPDLSDLTKDLPVGLVVRLHKPRKDYLTADGAGGLAVICERNDDQLEDDLDNPRSPYANPVRYVLYSSAHIALSDGTTQTPADDAPQVLPTRDRMPMGWSYARGPGRQAWYDRSDIAEVVGMLKLGMTERLAKVQKVQQELGDNGWTAFLAKYAL